MNKELSQKDQRILGKIRADKAIAKRIESSPYGNPDFREPELLSMGKVYLKAVRERSHFCVIHSVSKSGMSRTLTFYKGGKGGVIHFHTLFDCLRPGGVSLASEGWRVSGCGMDMVFHVHYCLIHSLRRLGFISKKECDKLAQETPTTL